MPSDAAGVVQLNEKTIPMTTPIIIACCIVIPLALLSILLINSRRAKRKAWQEEHE